MAPGPATLPWRRARRPDGRDGSPYGLRHARVSTCVRDLGGPSRRTAPACARRRQPDQAEQAAFEIQFIPLADARALVELYAKKGDRKYERAALKYLRRYMDETNPSLTDVAQVTALLAERDLMMRGLRCRVHLSLLSSDSARLRAPFMPQTSNNALAQPCGSRHWEARKPARSRALVVDRRQASWPSALLPKLRVVVRAPSPASV